MTHFDDAKTLLGLSDQSALESLTTTDSVVKIAKAVGAVVHILAAQVHATLAVVEQLEKLNSK